MIDYTCPCGSKLNIPIIQLVKSGYSEAKLERDKRLAKYKPMIKLVCSKCGRYIKFLEQDEKTIDWTNRVCKDSIAAIHNLIGKI